MKQIKSPSTVLHPCGQHDSVTLPHMSFDTSRAQNSSTPLLLLHVCSTTTNNYWNTKKLVMWGLGLNSTATISSHSCIKSSNSSHFRGTKVTERVKNNKWEGKREDVIRKASGTDSHFATHVTFKNLHQFWAAKLKRPLKLRRAPHLEELSIDSQAVCLPGHPSTWSYNFNSLRSSPHFLQCHHLKEDPLLYYSLLQHL